MEMVDRGIYVRMNRGSGVGRKRFAQRRLID